MRALSLTALFAGLAVGLTPSPAALWAQAVHRTGRPDVAADATRSPYFFVRSEDPSLDQMPLKATSARVAIAGVIADVKVTQVYRNTGTRPIEATYVFPGSTRAAVYGLTMHVGTRTLEAKIQGRAQARATYEQAKGEGRTASLLEQERPNVFQMNVANILPGDEIRVELRYTELLVPREGIYAFVYPTVVGPRYAGKAGTDSSTGEAWVANPTLPAGTPSPTTFDLQVKLAAGMPIARMACDTHRTAIAYRGGTAAEVKLDPSEAQGGNRDFILKYQLAGAQVQSGLLLHRGKDEHFFLLMAQPPKRVAPEAMPGREFVFVMDVSGSQMGFPIEVSKTLMKEMIQGLRPQDRFNVMVFEGSSAFWAPEGSRPANPENLAQALAFVRQQQAGGGTELGAALRKALALPRSEGFSRTFVVSTDGYISADGQVFDLIRKNLGDANLFTFGIGTSVNRHLIEGMAHVGMGEPFVITAPEQAAREAERFRAYVSTPALSRVKVEAHGFEIYDVEPLNLPDVLADRPILCMGKWKGEAKGTLTVSGVTGTGAWSQVFHVGDVPATSDNAALRQLWARERIRLLADYDGFGASPDRDKQVEALGLRYGLLTSQTSFVAVDTEVRNAGGQSTPVTQPLPLPEGVSNAAVGAQKMMAYAPAPAAPGLTRGGGWTAHRKARVGSQGAMADMAMGPRSEEIREHAPEAKAEPVAAALANLACSRTDLTLTTLQRELARVFQEADVRRASAGLGRGLQVQLQVDAQGRITALAFPSGSSVPEALRKALVGRRLAAWAPGQAGSLAFTLNP